MKLNLKYVDIIENYLIFRDRSGCFYYGELPGIFLANYCYKINADISVRKIRLEMYGEKYQLVKIKGLYDPIQMIGSGTNKYGVGSFAVHQLRFAINELES